MNFEGNWWLLYVPGSFWSDPDYVAKRLPLETCSWTCNKDVEPGDYGLLYSTSPVSSIVAILTVKSQAREETEPLFHSSEEWWCDVTFIKELDPPLTYRELKEDAELREAWGLVRSQMQSSRGSQKIPSGILQLLSKRIPDLADVLGDESSPCTDTSDYRWAVFDPAGEKIGDYATQDEARTVARMSGQNGVQHLVMRVQSSVEAPDPDTSRENLQLQPDSDQEKTPLRRLQFNVAKDATTEEMAEAMTDQLLKQMFGEKAEEEVEEDAEEEADEEKGEGPS